MKTYFYLILALLFTGIISCRKNHKNQPENRVIAPVIEKKNLKPATNDECKILAEYFKTHGDFINSPYCPALIDAKAVYKNLNNPAYLIIDLRTPDDFRAGHIKGAVNVSLSRLPDYFKTEINPADYEAIVLVCYSGQSASFGSGLMQLAGYDNVYAMKFGMSAWDEATAKKYWLKNISDKYAGKLETTPHPKPPAGPCPQLYTGETEPQKILEKRMQSVLSDPFKARLVGADEVFQNPGKYFIINYWPEDQYAAGHIPGAVQYTPKKDLSPDAYLNTLPTDKPIVIYCYTGQHAAFVAAYLDLLGYDARILKYGANSFMHNILVKNKWHPFTRDKIMHYPVVRETVAAE